MESFLAIFGPLLPPPGKWGHFEQERKHLPPATGSQTEFRGPTCASLMVLCRGTYPPSFGNARTVTLEILKSGPPLARLLVGLLLAALLAC